MHRHTLHDQCFVNWTLELAPCVSVTLLFWFCLLDPALPTVCIDACVPLHCPCIDKFSKFYHCIVCIDACVPSHILHASIKCQLRFYSVSVGWILPYPQSVSMHVCHCTVHTMTDLHLVICHILTMHRHAWISDAFYRNMFICFFYFCDALSKTYINCSKRVHWCIHCTVPSMLA